MPKGRQYRIAQNGYIQDSKMEQIYGNARSTLGKTECYRPKKILRQLAKKLKIQCGAGGTIRDGVIEIQGEHRDTVIRALETEGIVAKKAGG